MPNTKMTRRNHRDDRSELSEGGRYGSKFLSFPADFRCAHQLGVRNGNSRNFNPGYTPSVDSVTTTWIPSSSGAESRGAPSSRPGSGLTEDSMTNDYFSGAHGTRQDLLHLEPRRTHSLERFMNDDDYYDEYCDTHDDEGNRVSRWDPISRTNVRREIDHENHERDRSGRHDQRSGYGYDSPSDHDSYGSGTPSDYGSSSDVYSDRNYQGHGGRDYSYSDDGSSDSGSFMDSRGPYNYSSNGRSGGRRQPRRY